MKCNEVLVNQTKSRSLKNDLDRSCPDLKKSVVKSKSPIISDGNCLFRALGWWISGDEDTHQLVRQKLMLSQQQQQQQQKF